MELLTLTNVVSHALQVIVVVALGTLAAAAVRVDSAGVRYAYWRLLLATCLFLPLAQLLRPAGSLPAVDSVAPASSVTVVVTPTMRFAAGAVAPTIEWLNIIAAVLALGIAARLAWFGGGLISLRRLRGLGLADPDDHDIAELQHLLRTNADVRFVAGLRQPATFGWRRPVVLLPASLRDEAPAIRRALICHELVHVQRRDWVWVMSEELLLALLWFNPAVWWVVDRIRLAREESVDEIAILATGSRKTYVRALLAFAEDAPLAPAPAFAHRRHLFRRIALISREAVMSSRRIVLSCAVMALVLLSGSWYAAGAFPLALGPDAQEMRDQPGPLELRARPVTAQNPVPKRTDYVAAEYPAEARALGVAGSIQLKLTLDDVGRVGEVRRTSFTIESTNPQVNMSFSNASMDSVRAALEKATSPDQAKAILGAVDVLTRAAIRAVEQWRYEAPAEAPIAFDVRVVFRPDGETVASTARGVTGIQMPSTLNTAGAVRVGGGIKPPMKVRDVRPIYPPEAQAARVSGMVIIEARIGPDGSVEDARILRSVPILDQAALDAVSQWKFAPTLLNGVPTPVIMTVTVNFTLQ